jgi:predicted nuclease of predicted toxin-antitoxin system
MRFLVDAQLPPALARWLVTRGHEAQHLVDIGMQGASDRTIWDIAQRTDSIIISKDEDFALRKTLDRSGPPVVWVRLPNSRRRELLQWFEIMLPQMIKALERGDHLVELS